MRTKIAAATFALIGAGATGIGALSNVNMQGSDTLFLITKDVVTNCAGTGTINYVGSGSSNGQNNTLNTCRGTNPTPPVTRQTITPMSRALNGSLAAGACGCTAGANPGQVNSAVAGANAEGLAFALDGLSMIANGTFAPASCGGISHTKAINVSDVNGDGLVCHGCVGTTYTPDGALDFLRVLFFGLHHNNAGSVCVGGPTPGIACTADAQCGTGGICAGDCSSDVRRTLLSNYEAMFQSPCPSGVTNCPQGIRHLWRRDDGSGTTDVIASVIGGGATIGKFCNVNGGKTTTNGQVLGGTAKNGTDFHDNDPVRVACAGLGIGAAGGEQICGDASQAPPPGAAGKCLRNPTIVCTTNAQCPAGDICSRIGTLGALLTVFVPETVDVPAADTYPPALCTSGVFEAYQSSRSTYLGPCPSGGESFGAKCFHGAIRNPDNSLNPNCIVGVTSTRCPLLTPSGTECRGANLWKRKSSGDPNLSMVVDTSFPPSRTNPAPPVGGRYYLGAFYQIHVNARITNGTGFCTRPSSTEQIGCLASVASPCSTGYAGRSAADIPPAVALNVGGVPPDDKHIQNLVQPDPLDPAVYPISRKLYLNTLIGFEHVNEEELNLAKCFSSEGTMYSGATAPPNLVTTNGFVAMPETSPGSGIRIRCESFNEVVCTGGGNNLDSCTNNPVGIKPN